MNTEEIVEVIKQSLNEISKRHYEIENPASYNKTSTHPERNFVSALSNNIYSNMKSLGFNEDTNPELFPQSDFSKKITENSHHQDLRNYFKITNMIVPDLFFHKSQYDNSPENQKVVIECKTEIYINKAKIQKDIAKLILYIEQLNYQKGILLVCNNSPEIIKNYISDFMETYGHYVAYKNIEIWIKNFNEAININIIK